jgi:hypothetical protein
MTKQRIFTNPVMRSLNKKKPCGACGRAREECANPAGYQNWAMRARPRFARLAPNRRENDNVTADFSFEDGGYLIEVYASEVQPGQWMVRSVFQRLSDLDDEYDTAAVIRHESDVIFESMPHAMLAGREQAKQLVRSGSVGL